MPPQESMSAEDSYTLGWKCPFFSLDALGKRSPWGYGLSSVSEASLLSVPTATRVPLNCQLEHFLLNTDKSMAQEHTTEMSSRTLG